MANKPEQLEMPSRDEAILGVAQHVKSIADKRIAELEAALDASEKTVQGFAKRFCLNHCAMLSGERLLRNDGKCEICEWQNP